MVKIEDRIEKLEKELADLKAGVKTKMLVSVVLDESGSMSGIQKDTIDGFNLYIDNLKKDDKGEYRVNLMKFDTSHGCNFLFENATLDTVKLTTENYVPAGGTPLYDALGKAIQDTARIADRETSVFFVVITDGEENSSRSFSRNSIFDLIGQKVRNDKWNFVYLGANQDAWAVGGALGITNSYNFRPANIHNVFYAASTGTAAYSAGGGRVMSSAGVKNVMDSNFSDLNTIPSLDITNLTTNTAPDILPANDMLDNAVAGKMRRSRKKVDKIIAK